MSTNPEIRKIFKISNSLAVIVPPNIAHEFEIQEGNYVSIKIEGDKIVIEKVM